MEKRERNYFGAFITNKENPNLKEILIVHAASETKARNLMDECAKKTGWQLDGHVYQVMEYPQIVSDSSHN